MMSVVVPLFRALAAAAVGLLVLCLPALGEGQEPASPPAASQAASAIAKAQALMKKRRFVEALTVLRPLVASGGDDGTVLFLTGLAAIGASAKPGTSKKTRDALLDAAIAALRTMLVEQPGLVRVRLELARAFFLKGEDTLAKRHFERVLAGALPPAVVANVQRFLGLIRARRRWEARFGMALAPDSNLNTASGTRTIWLDTPFGRLPFTRSAETAPKSGFGVSVWGGGEYQVPLTARWRVRSGADASVREYKGGSFDRYLGSAYLGPRWLIDARTEASLLATVQREWTAGQPNTDQFGFRLEGARRLTPRLSMQARAGVRRRNCRDCNWLDGPVGEVGLGANWVALPILRVGGNAGWNWARANSEHWRSAGPRASLGATLSLPLGFTVGTHAAMQWTDYQGRGFAHRTIDRQPRKDRTQTLALSVHNRAVTVLGFSPRLSVINEQRETNAQALDYERNRAELSFVRQF